MWFTEIDGKKVGRIGRITPQGAIREYPLPAGSELRNIVAGRDGNLWFLDGGIVRITPEGKITKYPRSTGEDGPYSIAAGSDGNIWWVGCFTIGRMTPNGAVKKFPLKGPCQGGKVVASDGRVWFSYYDRIGWSTYAGRVTTFPPKYDPFSMVAGPDGNLWFVKFDTYLIGRLTPKGVLSKFPSKTGQQPNDITIGPDGYLWFTAGNKIARIV